MPPLTTELAAHECLKIDVSTFSQLILIRSFFELAGNNDMHNILDEFEFRPDRPPTTKLAAL